MSTGSSVRGETAEGKIGEGRSRPAVFQVTDNRLDNVESREGIFYANSYKLMLSHGSYFGLADVICIPIMSTENLSEKEFLCKRNPVPS